MPPLDLLFKQDSQSISFFIREKAIARKRYKNKKMAFRGVVLFLLITLFCVLPHLGHADNAGSTTRHYEFNVSFNVVNGH